MKPDRRKATVVLSSDHAGINPRLSQLELEIRRTLARIDDPRAVRDYIRYLVQESREFCDARQIGMRPWLVRTRKQAG